MLLDGRTVLFGYLKAALGGWLGLALNVKDLLHLHEQLIVLVPHFPAGGGVDPHGFIVAGEVVDLELVELVDLWSLVGHCCPDRQEQFEDLASLSVTVMMECVESNPL